MTHLADSTEEIYELRVSGTTAPKELAGSIVSNVVRGRTVVLAAIGHQAIGQAIKSVPIANRDMAPNGFLLAILPAFEVKHIRNTPDGEDLERTAAMMTLIKVRVR